MCVKLEKLHFITLNYAQITTLHPKLFECTVCTLNYDPCYTLYPGISFTVKLDKNMEASINMKSEHMEASIFVHNPFINTLKIEFKCPYYTIQEHQLQIAFVKVNVIYLFFFTDWSLRLCPRNCTKMEASINMKSEHCPILYLLIISNYKIS